MKLIHAKDYGQMSRLAAEIIADIIRKRPDAVLGLATGSTPIGLYRELCRLYRKGQLDFLGVRTFNLDEYVGLTADDPNSYHAYMRRNLFDHVNIAPGNTHLPNGAAEDISAECKRYDSVVEGLGDADIQLLGIGPNGHIGFNEPHKIFDKGTHAVELAAATVQANSKIFHGLEQTGARAITLGIDRIMQAKRILLIADGSQKREILERALFGEVTPNVPASVLQLHRNLTVVEACGLEEPHIG